MKKIEWHALIAAFKRRNIACEVVADRAAARARAQALIVPGNSVTFTGSRTVHQVGLHDYLRAHANDYTLYDPYRPGIEWPERVAINRQGMNADWMVTGANAITMKGEIVNLDGTGNRVSGMIFGPKRVLIMAGYNKIVPDLTAAMKRVREVAAPLNNQRLKFGNPCEKDGVCHDCASPTRICRTWGIIEGQMDPDRMTVLMVEEELGF